MVQPRFYRGSSMAGTLRPGDLLLVRPVLFSDVAVGDVVVFRVERRENSEQVLVHRVTAIDRAGLLTRGDSNPRPDPQPVKEHALEGVVDEVERSGRRVLIVGGKAGLRRVRLVRVRARLWRAARSLGGPGYRLLRRSGLVARFWQPRLRSIAVLTRRGSALFFLHRGRCVARWWPAEDRLDCRKPYDLAIDTSIVGQYSGAQEDLLAGLGAFCAADHAAIPAESESEVASPAPELREPARNHIQR